MKKIMIFVSIFAVAISAGYYAVKLLSKKSTEVYDTSSLSTTTINNITVETTGVIPAGDEGAALAIKEGINLLSRGPVSKDEFQISMPGDGSVSVNLKAPFNSSKDSFIKWLRDNGYSHLDPTQFNYTYSEQ